MSYRISSSRPQSISYSDDPPLAQKITEDPVTQKTAQSTVSCIYKTHIAGFWRNVTVLWCKNLTNHTLTISIDSVETDSHHSCKIDLKPWQFWCKKGDKTFEVDGDQVEIYWDLRSAKFFSSGPEPCSDFYVALVSEDEVVLLLGDYKKKAYKKTKSRPALVEALMFYKKENVFNKRSFSTRAKFDQKESEEHEIVVESSTAGPRDPEMWISIDGIVLIHIRNLQWKFRGNQTVLMNKLPVQVFWDVHAWLFCPAGSSHGLFIFKPGPLEWENENDESSCTSCAGDSSDCSSSNSRYYSTQSHSKMSEFCLFLCAWKLE